MGCTVRRRKRGSWLAVLAILCEGFGHGVIGGVWIVPHWRRFPVLVVRLESCALCLAGLRAARSSLRGGRFHVSNWFAAVRGRLPVHGRVGGPRQIPHLC